MSAALGMLAKLEQRGVDVDLFVPLSTRLQCDMNRAPCRDTAFRKRLSEYLLREKPDLLLDVHSFPDGDDSYGYHAVALLSRERDPRLIRVANNTLRGEESIAVMRGSDVNDIILEADNLGIPNMLIEFNESLIGKQALNSTETDPITGPLVESILKEYKAAAE